MKEHPGNIFELVSEITFETVITTFMTSFTLGLLVSLALIGFFSPLGLLILIIEVLDAYFNKKLMEDSE